MRKCTQVSAPQFMVRSPRGGTLPTVGASGVCCAACVGLGEVVQGLVRVAVAPARLRAAHLEVPTMAL